MYVFGVDIGGTGVKSGIVNKKGEILIKSSVPTDKGHDYRVIVKDIAAQLVALCSESGIKIDEISGIGIGCPGAIDSAKGIVNYSNNLEWSYAPLSDEFGKYFQMPVRIGNDANVAALGETVFGAGKAYHDTVMITLGTGVGGGVVIENRLFEGNGSAGTELGHTVIMTGGELCTCGRRGCLEAYASATALIRDTKVEMKKNRKSAMWDYVGGDIDKVDGRTSFECAKKGDYSAKRVVDNYIEYLGEGLCNFVNIFRPQAIILGGGVCAQGKNLTDPLEKYIETFSYGGDRSPHVDLIIASLGNDAGLIGAASLFFNDAEVLR